MEVVSVATLTKSNLTIGSENGVRVAQALDTVLHQVVPADGTNFSGHIYK